MNILPKKSWHVRTKKNIERVRRDEEQAAEEEKERQRRIALAEQESRTEALRDRARKRGHNEIEAAASSSSLAIEPAQEAGSTKLAKPSKDISLNQGGHINFFKDIEEGLRREGKNKEHEAEKAAEKEKWEKDIGLLTYLGQSAVESQNERPWYLQKSEKSEPEKKFNPYEVKAAERHDRDQKLKTSLDPLQDMRKHFEKQHKHKHQHKDKEKHHKHKKSSKGDRDKPSSSKTSSSSSPALSKSSKTIEQLRAERLRREAAEKQKIAAVMMRARGETVTKDADDFVSDADRDRSRGYNSRYNPDFVKPLSHHKR